MSADWAIVEEYEDGGVIDRYETEREALDVLEQYRENGTADADYAVKWVPDPTDDSPRIFHPIGPFGGFYTAPGEQGYAWGRDGCWYGSEVGGDEAVTLAFTAYYVKPADTEGHTLRCDASYYPYGKPGDYGVVEVTEFYEVDGEGEPVDDGPTPEYEGMYPSFETLADALVWAKRQAERDLRLALN